MIVYRLRYKPLHDPTEPEDDCNFFKPQSASYSTVVIYPTEASAKRARSSARSQGYLYKDQEVEIVPFEMKEVVRV